MGLVPDSNPPAKADPLVAVLPLSRLEAALDAAVAGDRRGFVASGDATEFDPQDPRDIGYAGAYPQINRGNAKPPEQILRESYKRTAAGRVLVDRMARDTWAPWLKWVVEDEDLKLRLEAFCRNPTGQPEGRPLWWWLERCDRAARRDGRALLYLVLEDSSGDSSQQPKGVRGVRGIQVIQDDAITGVDLGKDPKNPTTFGQPQAWLVNQTGIQGVPIVGGGRIHPERVIAFIPEPTEKDLWDGDSVLESAINYIEWGENLNWAAAEAFGRRASPMIAVSIDAGVSYGDAEKTALREQVKRLKNGTTQILVAKGIKAEVIQGSSALPDPTPYHQMALDNLAMVLGVPKAILVGDAAGDLAASQEDSRRNDSRMMMTREQYADPILRGLYTRLIQWAFESWVTPDMAPVDFEWSKTYQPTAKEQAEVEGLQATARVAYKNASIPLPATLAYESAPFPVQVDDDGEPIEDEEDSPALNGAQMEQVVAIVTAVGKGELGAESAVAILTSGLPITEEEARRMVGDTGEKAVVAEERKNAFAANVGAAPKPGVNPFAKKPEPDEEPAKENPFAKKEPEDEEVEKEPAQDALQGAPKGVPRLVQDFQRDAAAAYRQAFTKNKARLKAKPGAIKSYAKRVGKDLKRFLVPAVVAGQKAAYDLGRKNVKVRPTKDADVAAADEEEEFWATASFRRIAEEIGEDAGARVSQRIRDSLLAGAAKGETIKTLSERVQDIYGLSDSEATRIARTETSHSYNRAAKDNIKGAGYEEFIFLALFDADEECAERDGEKYRVDDMDNQPGLIHVNCRCTMRAPHPGEDGQDVILRWDTWEGLTWLRTEEGPR